MKPIYLVIALIAIGCNGKLSDEQRKKFKEGMEQQKIVHVTEPEIMEGTLKKGQTIVALLEGKPYSKSKADSVAKANRIRINYAVPGSTNALALEQELIDAYIAGMVTGSVQENLQKVYNTPQRDTFDSLLYSKPSISKLADGTEQLDGVWNIYIPKKEVVLEISKTK